MAHVPKNESASSPPTPCPTPGCTREAGHAGRHNGQPKGTYNDRWKGPRGKAAKATGRKAQTTAAVDVAPKRTREDVDLEKAAEVLKRFADLLGVEVATFRCPKGMGFLNVSNAQVAVLTGADELLPGKLQVAV